MKKNLLMFLFTIVFLISIVLAVDFTPQGNINLRDIYNITGAPYINATLYYGNASEMTGTIALTNSSSYWDGLDVPTDLNNLLTLNWANITSKFITAVDNVYLYMSGTTATLNETKFNETGDARYVNSDTDTMSGNLTANYFIGDGDFGDISLSGDLFMNDDSEIILNIDEAGDTGFYSSSDDLYAQRTGLWIFRVVDGLFEIDEDTQFNDDVQFDGEINVSDDITTIGDIIADNFIGDINWTYLQNYPVVCPSGTYITAINDSVICTSISIATHYNLTINDTVINSSGITTDGNITLGQTITFTLGEIIDNIVDNWIRITGGLNVTGNITASNFFGSWNGSSSYVPYTGANQDVQIGANNFSVNTNSLFVNKENGNVGIGTTSPDNILDIVKTGLGLRLTTNKFLITDVLVGETSESGQTLSNLIENFNNYQGLLLRKSSTGSGDYFSVETSAGATQFIIKSTGNVGIGTTNPTLAKLQVNGSESGISIYAENNISAEDYLYHSPFPSEDYTNEQALNDLIKINGKDGKLNHSSVPSNAVSILEKPIYETIINQTEVTEQVPVMENYTYNEQECSYVEKSEDKYDYVCVDIEKTAEKQKQICYNETREKYESNFDNSTNETYFIKIEYSEQVCEGVYKNITRIENITTQNQIGIEEEPQTSVGMMIGNIVKSIQKLFNWNSEQDDRIEMLESELCKKDNSYKFCKVQQLEL